MVRIVAACAQNRSGSIALVFALLLPVLLLITGGAIDYALVIGQKSRLQSIVDAAALSAARELSLSNNQTEKVDAIVQALIESYVTATKDPRFPTPIVKTIVTTQPLQVAVKAAQKYASPFGDTFGIGVNQLEAKAVARVTGRLNVCMLALHASTNGALSLEQNAQVTGENCGVYSNSTHNIGVKAKDTASLTATTICSGGGVQDTAASFNPPPFKDCPAFENPLQDRPEPAVGNCNPALPTEITSSRELRPGTYCGGLTITSGADVTLAPGIYVIKDGPMVVNGNARITGKGVGIYLSGRKAALDFQADSTVILDAPKDGAMAGLLVHSSKSTTAGNQHKIYSENAQVMVGTVYIPTGELRVDGAANIGAKSAYTAIVAETIRLYGGPHIVLNTSYDETDVPVPEGIKGAGQPVQLVQ